LKELKENKVLSFKGNGLEFEISPMAYVPDYGGDMFETAKPNLEDDLYYSVGGKQ
jgi:hypothetical protein